MTIDEAIKHCEEVAEQNETKALRIGRQYEGTLLDREAKECRKCAADHRQLAEWLRELKEAKRLLKQAVDDISVLLSENDSCYYCKHYVAGECLCVDDCNRSCEWHCTDDVKKLLKED